MIRFLDIFAGAGGLSEGFIRAGYTPVSHIEMDKAACYTLRTRVAYHYLKKNSKINIYKDYLNGNISREELYSSVPLSLINSVIQEEISSETINSLFEKIDYELKGESLDLIIGGPPCQAYSIAGRSRDPNRMVGDKRNYLYILYAEFLARYKPKFFVFENVIGLLSAKDIDGELYLSKMKSLFKEKGYEIEYKVLNAKDYGILQNRKRIIIIGKRGDKTGFYPEIKKIHQDYLVNDILQDLPKIKAGDGKPLGTLLTQKPNQYLIESKIATSEDIPLTLHCARPNNEQDLEIYKIAVEAWDINKKRLNYANLTENLKTHKNSKDFTDRFKVVAGDISASQTIVAHIAKDGHYYIHPDKAQNRSLTPREAARLQSFPDDFYFESISGKPSRTFAYKQIGNAVPVLLAEKIAEAMIPLFEKK